MDRQPPWLKRLSTRATIIFSQSVIAHKHKTRLLSIRKTTIRIQMRQWKWVVGTTLRQVTLWLECKINLSRSRILPIRNITFKVWFNSRLLRKIWFYAIVYQKTTMDLKQILPHPKSLVMGLPAMRLSLPQWDKAFLPGTSSKLREKLVLTQTALQLIMVNQNLTTVQFRPWWPTWSKRVQALRLPEVPAL